MICQVCGKNEATTHVKTVINGKVRERDICTECAKKEGIGNWNPFQGFPGFENPFFSLSNLFGSFLENPLPESVTHCPVCGCSFQDISQSGKVGCSECYHVFYDQLLPSIQRIHGNTHHTGKNPVGNEMQVMPQAHLTVAQVPEPTQQEKQLAQWKQEMQQAIAEQNFEQAAVLRDKIKELEQGKGED
jgi:protein arginine kinase activator